MLKKLVGGVEYNTIKSYVVDDCKSDELNIERNKRKDLLFNKINL